MMLATFHMLIVNLCILLCEMTLQIFSSILTWFLSYYQFVVSLYVSGNNSFIRYMYCKHSLCLHLTFPLLTCLVISRSFSFRQSLIYHIFSFNVGVLWNLSRNLCLTKWVNLLMFLLKEINRLILKVI